MILLKEPSDNGFRYLLINAAGERLLGRDRDEILGRTERDLFPPERGRSGGGGEPGGRRIRRGRACSQTAS